MNTIFTCLQYCGIWPKIKLATRGSRMCSSHFCSNAGKIPSPLCVHFNLSAEKILPAKLPIVSCVLNLGSEFLVEACSSVWRHQCMPHHVSWEAQSITVFSASKTFYGQHHQVWFASLESLFSIFTSTKVVYDSSSVKIEFESNSNSESIIILHVLFFIV